MAAPPPPEQPEARIWRVSGRVQGVGFRPFIYRLASRHGLSGWVKNRSGQVEIFAQGESAALAAFGAALISEAPPLARPEILSCAPAGPGPHNGFAILTSEESEAGHVHVPPDYFACADCLAELSDPTERRHRYPFINCTQCGPRYTLIRRLPYDRPNTSMSDFPLCPACSAEYRNPADRRFHAQPLACPACGPRLAFTGPGEESISASNAALAACVQALRQGEIVAVKGIGGYHLLCDARNQTAIRRLRRVKPRPDKPLAVMFPLDGSGGLDAVRRETAPTAVEAEFLAGPMRPIVLVEKRPDSAFPEDIAPGLKEIGIMLPYSPLHYLLLEDFGGPLVATSANVSGEPVLTENAEIEQRLGHVAEAFLHHDRPILRPADDPVFRVIAGRPRPLRLGRGCAPLELPLSRPVQRPTLAVGGHMKNTVALAWGERVVISPHIGDLDAPRSVAVFEQVADDLQALYGIRAEQIVCDRHAGYASSRWAKRCGLPLAEVWHHHGHASAVAGEFPQVAEWLVFAWDGVGLGEDGTLWGGEALFGAPGRWRRVASMRPFWLPGGEKAGREPWRSAAALCWETGLTWKGGPDDAALAYQAWQKRLNCPQSSAVGRLFDAAAALAGLIHTASFEGQGPMLLEAAATGNAEPIPLPLARDQAGVWRSDWAPLLPLLLDESLAAAARAATFHASLAQALLEQARAVRAETGVNGIGLSGGVFQNRLLTEQTIATLEADGFSVYLPERLPYNDAGLSFGQIVEAAATRTEH
ncbi:MAG: carbamoyltransferase HypF [Pseudomonadota bacterium]